MVFELRTRLFTSATDYELVEDPVLNSWTYDETDYNDWATNTLLTVCQKYNIVVNGDIVPCESISLKPKLTPKVKRDIGNETSEGPGKEYHVANISSTDTAVTTTKDDRYESTAATFTALPPDAIAIQLISSTDTAVTSKEGENYESTAAIFTSLPPNDTEIQFTNSTSSDEQVPKQEHPDTSPPLVHQTESPKDLIKEQATELGVSSTVKHQTIVPNLKSNFGFDSVPEEEGGDVGTLSPLINQTEPPKEARKELETTAATANPADVAKDSNASQPVTHQTDAPKAHETDSAGSETVTSGLRPSTTTIHAVQKITTSLLIDAKIPPNTSPNIPKTTVKPETDKKEEDTVVEDPKIPSKESDLPSVKPSDLAETDKVLQEPIDIQQSDNAEVLLRHSEAAVPVGGVEGSEADKILSRMQPSSEQSEQNKVVDQSVNTAESTKDVTKASKDSTLLIVLFVAVLAIGAGAFTYNFVKKRRSASASPSNAENGIRKSFQNLNNSKGPDVEQGTELKPLMKSNDQKQVNEYSDNETDKVPRDANSKDAASTVNENTDKVYAPTTREFNQNEKTPVSQRYYKAEKA